MHWFPVEGMACLLSRAVVLVVIFGQIVEMQTSDHFLILNGVLCMAERRTDAPLPALRQNLHPWTNSRLSF